MEQVQQLLEILKQTPEMALWGLSIYFIFILLKLSSWVIVIKIILSQFIKRYFDFKDQSLDQGRGSDIVRMFEKKKIDSVDYTLLIELLNSVKKAKSLYIHESDIRDAINILNNKP